MLRRGCEIRCWSFEGEQLRSLGSESDGALAIAVTAYWGDLGNRGGESQGKNFNIKRRKKRVNLFFSVRFPVESRA